MCVTPKPPLRVGEGKGAGCSDLLNPKRSVEGLLDNPACVAGKKHDDSRFNVYSR
jgi:hypothetical protein